MLVMSDVHTIRISVMIVKKNEYVVYFLDMPNIGIGL